MPIAWIGHDETTLAATCFEPILPPDRAPISAARDADVRVVLLSAVNVVGKRVVHSDVVKLCSGLVVLCCPCFAAVDGDAGPAVAHIGDAIWVRGINPQPVMIAVTRGQESEIFSTIDRFKESGVYQVNCVRGFRVCINFAEIPGALTKPAIVIHASPVLPGIIRAVKPAFLGLDNRIDAIRIGSRNGDADLAQDSARKTVAFQTFPRHAIIFRTVKSAARAAAGEKPRLPPSLPKRREHDVRIMRIENDVDPASVFVF